MTAIWERHRYRGVVDGGRCAAAEEEGGKVCGLTFAASLHYNDADHPYTEHPDWFQNGDKGAGCAWLLQQRGEEGPVYCAEVGEVLHLIEEKTAAMIGDVPEGAWSAAEYAAALGHPSAGAVPPSESVGAVSEPPPSELSYPAYCAWALRNGDVVTSGPWPVRQWCAMDGGAPEWWENPGELICALNVSGEAFRVETWWVGPRRRMVRVTWGVALAWSDEEAAAMVESWPA